MVSALLPASRPPPESSEGPSSSVQLRESRCLGCGERVDPLRAGHVAILEDRFCYFCKAECKAAYLRTQGWALDEGETVSPPDVVETGAPRAGRASGPHPAAGMPLSPDRTDGRGSAVVRVARAPEGRRSLDTAPPSATSEAADRDAPIADPLPMHGPRLHLLGAVDVLGLAAGALVPGIGLLGPDGVSARVPLAALSLGALALRIAVSPRDPSDPHPAVVLVPALGAVASAVYALATHDPHAGPLAVFAGVACAVAIAVEVLVGRARSRVVAARARIASALDVPVRALDGATRVELGAFEVRPGEPVVVEAGEVVGVDAVVTAGEARVVPWLGAQIEVVRREGDAVLAGARVASSRLRMTTTWSGSDRAWVKLLSAPATRIDVAAPTALAVRRTVERGAPIAAVVVGLAAAAANGAPVEIFAAMCAGAIAFSAKAACAVVALHYARAHLDALAGGIVYRDARAFERAASANVAVLSARGTVLMGEPEIVAVEPVGSYEVEQILAFAAGAETISAHPFAAAILRAARARGVRPDPVRNGAAFAGLGVTAVASTGERLVVGGRAIMLKQKIGAAIIDARVSELEAQGRSVLLVALGDRIIGAIALQDGLRPGARAAVQKLLDTRIEPVLLSGEARETCATIGRALDIEHVRPEVLPGERGAEVRALSEGGNVVAAIGHPIGDDEALGAADVGIAMGAAGSTPAEWAVALASDDVRDAARSLAIPHAARERARMAAVIGAAPGILALLAIGFGVAPLALAPLAALVAAAAVTAHARESVAQGSA